MTSRPSPLIWLWLPVLFIAGQLVAELFILSDSQKKMLLDEGGIHETSQAILAAIGAVFAVVLTIGQRGLWYRLWYGIAAIGSFYVAGEEISWGQTYLQWATPDSWAEINDQNETNLHNTSDWLDQKPQALLQIGVLVGGLIIPALRRFKPAVLPQKFAAIYPLNFVVPTACVALFLKLADTIQDRLDQALFWRVSEVLEIYIYAFVALYLWLQWLRSKGRVTE